MTIKIFFTPALLRDTDFSNVYYDRNGQLMRITLSTDEKYRIYTPLNKISQTLRDATILYEDKFFYYHPGINPISLFRATKNFISGAPHPAGASTITMQVARLKYAQDTTTPIGKLKQIITAIYIDAFYSKSEILEAYLNLAPYGGNIEGIGAASQIYFHQSAQNISKLEAITLATIPQNPIKRGLLNPSGINSMQQMRTLLVEKWIQRNPNDTNLAVLAQLPLNAHNIQELPFLAPHFIDAQQSQTYRWHKKDTYHKNIITTLDINLQKKIHNELKNQINQRKSVGITNASAILVNYKTNEILSYIGSIDYFDKVIQGQNDGVLARRSPGSTLKPLIYAHAIDMGLIHSMTLLKDAKINFGVYAPENSDRQFYGPVLARDALTHSRNIPAIELTQKIGVKNFHKTLSDLGVINLKSPSYYGISIALGGAELSMYEIATLYTTMANLGLHQELRHTINQTPGHQKQILSPEAFFLTLDMLGSARQPSNKIPYTQTTTNNIHHYWKTGTSSSFRDAWTAGIFGDYVLVVWIGNFDGRPNNAFSGAKTAAPIYFALANTIIKHSALHNTPVSNNNFLTQDMNISKIDMCDYVGGIANEYCPNKTSTYFIPGKSPINISSIYRAIPIDNATGLRACTNDKNTTHMVVYEFWEPEFLDIFKRAGIKRNTPPRFVPGCDITNIANEKSPPIITSPIDMAQIIITDNQDIANIAFNAISDTPDTELFWMLDEKIIGKTQSGETITRPVPIGNHTIRVIDKMGTGRNIKFSVIK